MNRQNEGEDLADACDGADEFKLCNFIDGVDQIHALDALEVALVHAIHPQVAGLALGIGFATLADPYCRGTGVLQGEDMEIYAASIGPAGIACSAEVADGLIPVWMNPERFDLLAPHLEAGFRKAGGAKSLANFDVAPFVTCVVGDDLEKCRAPIKVNLALYIGGMGARGKNFYNDYAKRLGYEAEAVKIQDLYFAGEPAKLAKHTGARGMWPNAIDLQEDSRTPVILLL